MNHYPRAVRPSFGSLRKLAPLVILCLAASAWPQDLKTVIAGLDQAQARILASAFSGQATRHSIPNDALMTTTFRWTTKGENFYCSFNNGAAESWDGRVARHYQPRRKYSRELAWVNIGHFFPGNESPLFDPSFGYQVSPGSLVGTPRITDLLRNGRLKLTGKLPGGEVVAVMTHSPDEMGGFSDETVTLDPKRAYLPVILITKDVRPDREHPGSFVVWQSKRVVVSAEEINGCWIRTHVIDYKIGRAGKATPVFDWRTTVHADDVPNSLFTDLFPIGLEVSDLKIGVRDQKEHFFRVEAGGKLAPFDPVAEEKRKGFIRSLLEFVGALIGVSLLYLIARKKGLHEPLFKRSPDKL